MEKAVQHARLTKDTDESRLWRFFFEKDSAMDSACPEQSEKIGGGPNAQDVLSFTASRKQVEPDTKVGNVPEEQGRESARPDSLLEGQAKRRKRKTPVADSWEESFQSTRNNFGGESPRKRTTGRLTEECLPDARTLCGPAILTWMLRQ